MSVPGSPPVATPFGIILIHTFLRAGFSLIRAGVGRGQGLPPFFSLHS